jgi:hypothetical protein
VIKNTVLGASLVLVGLSGIPTAAHAESKFVTGTSTPLTASANLDFTITIPKFVYLRVGTGVDLADGTKVDNLVYNVPAASVGNGSAISATSGGDVSTGTVTARVIGNNGVIAFSSQTQGPLNNGAGDTISWSEIGVAVAANTTSTPLSHPALADGATTSINLPTTSSGGKITKLDAKWTFTYKNTNPVAAGTYGGVNTQNGRVTYAVSMP